MLLAVNRPIDIEQKSSFMDGRYLKVYRPAALFRRSRETWM
jgi:hypothetical protein